MKKKRKSITKAAVQETEEKPFVLPQADVKPEVDEDPWDEQGLTYRHRLFVQYYVGEAGGNSTKAARLAGYKDDNANALRVTAHQVLTNPNVQRALERELGKRFGTAEDVRNSVAAIANSSAADYMRPGPDGKMRLSLEALAEAGAMGLIHSIDADLLETNGAAQIIKCKVKLYDKLKALEILAKMNGQLKDVHDVNLRGKVKHTHEIKPAMQRLMGNPDAYARAKALAKQVMSPDDN